MNMGHTRIAPAVFVVLAAGAVAATHAAGQTAGPRPVLVSKAVYPISMKAGDYDLIVQVGDFPPGSGVGLHFHPGPVQATVVTGELTFVHGGTEKTVKAGSGWREVANDPSAIVNRSSGYARLVAASLVPKGAAPMTFITK